MNNVYIKKALRVTDMGGNNIQIENTGKLLLLQIDNTILKKAFLRLLSLLDGRNTLDEIKNRLSVSDPEFRVLVDKLNANELIEPASPEYSGDVPEDYARIFKDVFGLLNTSAKLYTKKERMITVYNYAVSVIGTNEMALEILKKLLDYGFRKIKIFNTDAEKGADIKKELVGSIRYNETVIDEIKLSGLEDLEKHDPGDFLVAPLTERNTGFYQELNEVCVGLNQNWIPVYYHETKGYIGPAVIPGKTACYKCMDLRFVSNVENVEAYNAYLKYHEVNKSNSLITKNDIQLIANNFINEFFRLAVRHPYPVSYDRVLELPCSYNRIDHLSVYPFPKCPVCADEEERLPYNNWDYRELQKKMHGDKAKKAIDVSN